MGCLATGVSKVSLQISDIEIATSVLMPDNIDYLCFFDGRIIEKLTVYLSFSNLRPKAVISFCAIRIKSEFEAFYTVG